MSYDLEENLMYVGVETFGHLTSLHVSGDYDGVLFIRKSFKVELKQKLSF